MAFKEVDWLIIEFCNSGYNVVLEENYFTK